MQTRLLILAAAGALGAGLGFPSAGVAQYRVGSQGHALDANNQVGSGGINGVAQYSTTPGQPTPVTANDIFMGNVTGLGVFQGGVPYRNPYSFQGGTPYLPSEILQQQSGVSSPTAPPTYNKPQPFYPESTTIVAPPGFSQVGSIQGFVPTPAPVQQSQDYRLGNTLDIPTVSLPHPDQATGPGPVDPMSTLTPSNLTGAPLFGATLMAPLTPGASFGELNQTRSGSVITTPLSGLNQSDILRLRGEVSQTVLGNPALATAISAPGATPQSGAASINSKPVNNATPVTSAVPVTNFAQNSSTSTSLSPTPGSFSTGQTDRRIPAPLPPASQQSPQYAKLKELLAEYQSAHPKTDEEANRLFQATLKARREYEQSLLKGPGGKPAPGISVSPGNPVPGDETPPSSPSTPPPSDELPPSPLQIGSIGKSITAAGLSKLVQQGEDLARHQQFKDAISKFLDARQVAPNNSLIAIDLANAELGAGFFHESEGYLREAFTADPALLMGKYDLTGIIGDDRLQIIISDLKRIAADGDSETPVFLLAYLSYNTGDNQKAVEYLKLAQTRAGGDDPLIRSLSDHWLLQATVPASQPSR